MKIHTTLFLILLFSFSTLAQKQAEVIVTSTFLRKLPNATSEKVLTVQKGDKITVEKSQDTNGWYYVSVANSGVKGWIRKDTIGQLVKIEKVAQTTVAAPSKNPPVKSPPTANPTAAASKTTLTPPAEKPTLPTVTAAKPIEEEEVVRVETEEVNINVRVIDGNNRTVRNLDQSQFKIYEDDVLQPITSLTSSEIPVVSALVIDNSRSLRAQLEKVIEAGKIIVGMNRPKDESAVVRFVSKDKIETVQNFTLSKNSLDNALNNLFVEGGQTAIIDAIYQTAKKVDDYQKSQKKDDARVRALILVSDGDDRNSSYSERQLFDLLRQSQVQIYAVGFTDNLSKTPDANGVNRQEKAKSFLSRLSEETGGKVYFPSSINELPQIAADISAGMRTQYLISYTPTNEIRGGGFRKIKVEIADGADKEKRIAIARTGRTATPK